RHECAADAGVLPRHGARRGGRDRHRAWQDTDREVPDGGRAARRWHADAVLRAERPAARGGGGGPLAGGRQADADGGGGECRPGGFADAGAGGAGAGERGRPGGAGAEAVHAGGDEDGDDGVRGPGRHGGGGAGDAGDAGGGGRAAAVLSGGEVAMAKPDPLTLLRRYELGDVTLQEVLIGLVNAAFAVSPGKFAADLPPLLVVL